MKRNSLKTILNLVDDDYLADADPDEKKEMSRHNLSHLKLLLIAALVLSVALIAILPLALRETPVADTTFAPISLPEHLEAYRDSPYLGLILYMEAQNGKNAYATANKMPDWFQNDWGGSDSPIYTSPSLPSLDNWQALFTDAPDTRYDPALTSLPGFSVLTSQPAVVVPVLPVPNAPETEMPVDGTVEHLDPTGTNMPSYEPNEPDGEGSGMRVDDVSSGSVEGVEEGGLLKRTEDYFFYLDDYELIIQERMGGVKSVLGSDVSVYTMLGIHDPVDFRHTEFYLSEDGMRGIAILYYRYQNRNAVCVVQINTSKPWIRPYLIQKTVFYGDYQSSRLIGDTLVLSMTYQPNGALSYDDPRAFLPSYQTQGGEVVLLPKDLLLPTSRAELSKEFTMLYCLDVHSFAVTDQKAYFAEAEVFYPSKDSVYLVSTYDSRTLIKASETQTDAIVHQMQKSDILSFGVKDGKLTLRGSLTVNGKFLKDDGQYGEVCRFYEANGVLYAIADSKETLEEISSDTGYRTNIKRHTGFYVYAIDPINCAVVGSRGINVLPVAVSHTAISDTTLTVRVGERSVKAYTFALVSLDLVEERDVAVTKSYYPFVSGYYVTVDTAQGIVISLYHEEAGEMVLSDSLTFDGAYLPQCNTRYVMLSGAEAHGIMLDAESGYIGFPIGYPNGEAGKVEDDIYYYAYSLENGTLRRVAEKTLLSVAGWSFEIMRSFYHDHFIYVFGGATSIAIPIEREFSVAPLSDDTVRKIQEAFAAYYHGLGDKYFWIDPPDQLREDEIRQFTVRHFATFHGASAVMIDGVLTYRDTPFRDIASKSGSPLVLFDLPTWQTILIYYEEDGKGTIYSLGEAYQLGYIAYEELEKLHELYEASCTE